MKTPHLVFFACAGICAITFPAEAVTVPLTGGDAGESFTIDAVNFINALNVASGTARTVQTQVFDVTVNSLSPGATYAIHLIQAVGNFNSREAAIQGEGAFRKTSSSAKEAMP